VHIDVVGDDSLVQLIPDVLLLAVFCVDPEDTFRLPSSKKLGNGELEKFQNSIAG
jgi:hypothetical protein